MEGRETGDERLAAICQMIRNETLDPAKEEAEKIRQAAERDAAKTRTEAKRYAEKIIHEARTVISEEREAFDASMKQAAKKALGLLKEKIEKTLLNPSLDRYLTKQFNDEQKTAKILDLVIQNLEEEGIYGDLSVWLGKNLSKDVVLSQLCQQSLSKIEAGSLSVGDQAFGIVLKIVDRHLSIEITPEGLKEMIAAFLRPDFRSILFSE